MSTVFLDYPDPRSVASVDLDGLGDALGFRFLPLSDAPFAEPDLSLRAAAQLAWARLGGSNRREGVVPPALPPSLFADAIPGPAGTPSVGFLLRSDGRESSVALGHPDRTRFAEAARAAVGGPAPVVLPRLPDVRGLPAGCLFGWPEPEGPGFADLLLDGLAGTPFVWLVFATAEDRGLITQSLRRLEAGAEHVERTWLRTAPSGDVDRRARHVRDQLDCAISRHRRGLAGGLWRTSMLLFCPDPSALGVGLALLSGALGGGSELGVALRGHRCRTDGQGWSPHASTVFPAELARLCALPTRDRPGFSIGREVAFDTDHPVETGLSIGEILDRERGTGRELRVPARTLCRHALIAGQTGSGKSTTARRLLAEAAREGVPFLVVDPVKPGEAEYARLAAQVSDLWVLRVGASPRAGEIPFQLNPLSFPSGFPLSTHLDYLKSAFIAAFGLYPPLPFLLENALHRAYSERGWNLATGEHPRPDDRLSMPTLSDLLAAVDPVLQAAGYAGDIATNLRAALRTRIAALCQGPRGLALDTRDNLPDEALFGTPLVLDLSLVGSPEEQAFVMGLVLTRLFEVRYQRGILANESLGHLVLIEEAHRLLKQVPRGSGEEASPAARAVETLTNLLAEVRAYGQGIIVAEQIPSNLAINVVKQTSLKIVHRLSPREDRELLGDAMVLDAEQKRALATLPTGRAVVHAEGMDGAVLVSVSTPAGSTRAVDWAARARRHVPAALRARIERRLTRARLDPALGARALVREVNGAFVRVAERRGAAEPLRLCREAARRELRSAGLPSGDADAGVLVAFAVEDGALARALGARWTDKAWDAAALAIAADPAAWLDGLAARPFRAKGPHEWCDRCPAACRYAWEGATFPDSSFQAHLGDAIQELGADRCAELTVAVDLLGDRLLPSVPKVPKGLGYCAIGHALERMKLPLRGIRAVLADWLIT